MEGEGDDAQRKSQVCKYYLSTGISVDQWHVTPDHLLMPCVGYWGVAIKEWEVIKQVNTTKTRPDSLMEKSIFFYLV